MVTKMHDILELGKSLSYTKFKNVLALQRSFKKATKAKQLAVAPPLPYAISIEPTTSCNLRCPECPSGLRAFSRPTGQLNVELFERIIEDVNTHIMYLIIYFQGEPYLNPSFFDFIRIASSHRIYTATSTNAHYLDDKNAEKTVRSGLSRLIISIDGTTQETYESYRVGGRLEKVLEGAANIRKWKKKLKSKTPYTIFQFLVVKPNEHEIEEVKTLAKKYGIDQVAFKTAQIYDYKNGNPLIPSIEKFSRYRKVGKKYELKNELLDRCWKMWHSAVVTWDGKVVPCCFDKDGKYVMGDLSKEKFADIWSGEKYQDFRRRLLSSRKDIDICANCTEGGKTWA